MLVKHQVAEDGLAGYYKSTATVSGMNLWHAATKTRSVQQSSGWLPITAGIGYRMVTYMLRNEGIWSTINEWNESGGKEGLKLPKKQVKKRRLWLTDGSCIRLRARHKNHVWSYDFVEDRTSNGPADSIPERLGRTYAWMPCQRAASKVGGTMTWLSYSLTSCWPARVPEYMRSDNGGEFTANRIRKWLRDAGSITAYIEPGSPWENGYIESFNARMRAEFLNGELFDTMFEAQVLTQRWIRYYNQIRPHSSLGGRPPFLKPWFQSPPRISSLLTLLLDHKTGADQVVDTYVDRSMAPAHGEAESQIPHGSYSKLSSHFEKYPGHWRESGWSSWVIRMRSSDIPLRRNLRSATRMRRGNLRRIQDSGMPWQPAHMHMSTNAFCLQQSVHQPGGRWHPSSDRIRKNAPGGVLHWVWRAEKSALGEWWHASRPRQSSSVCWGCDRDSTTRKNHAGRRTCSAEFTAVFRCDPGSAHATQRGNAGTTGGIEPDHGSQNSNVLYWRSDGCASSSRSVVCRSQTASDLCV